MPVQLLVHVIDRNVPKVSNKDRESVERYYGLRYGSGSYIEYMLEVLFHIYKESRSLAIKRFKPFLGGPRGDLPVDFDFEGDTMFFDNELAWNCMTDKSEQELRAGNWRLLVAVEAAIEEEAQENKDDVNKEGSDYLCEMPLARK